jgi:hypothetical protein
VLAVCCAEIFSTTRPEHAVHAATNIQGILSNKELNLQLLQSESSIALKIINIGQNQYPGQ